MSEAVHERLVALGIVLPDPAPPIATYVPCVQTGNLVVVSGQLPIVDGHVAFTGKLRVAAQVEQGQQAAQRCMVNVLAQLRAALDGDLGRVRRVVRLGGFIACEPEFTAHAAVMNGASDLAVAVFEEAGRHARSTIGVPCLPADAMVEVEGMFEVE